VSLRLEAQITEIQYFTNLNKSIPDGNAAGLSDVRSVTSSIVNLSSVRVKLRTIGEFNGDLYSYLRHIQGSSTNFCVLLGRVGRTQTNSAGYADGGLDVSLDDAASLGDIHLYRLVTNLPAGTPLSGTWQPDGRRVDPDIVTDTTLRTATLSVFNGADASGQWTLYLADMAAGGTNVLANWELRLTGAARPIITWSQPADIVYGTALGATQLNATSSVPGTFAYTPPAETVLSAGSNQPLSVTFTPADSGSYISVTTNVLLNVLKADAVGLLVASTNPALPGQAVVFTFSLNSAGLGTGKPTGAVQFKIDGTNAGIPVAIVSGIASYNTASLTHGIHAVSAEYSGDGNFKGMTNSLSPGLLINTPPVASPIAVQRYPTTGTKLSVSTVLANAADADGDAIIFAGVSATSVNAGTVGITNGWIYYTPAAGYTNSDIFTYRISDGLGEPVAGGVTVNIRQDNGPSPNLTITPVGGGSYLIHGDGIPGFSYRIEYSDTPDANWQTLGSATADSFGVFQFTDPSGSPQRFYRSVYP
jgi:subtilisin-like proprotein convertase family protein